MNKHFKRHEAKLTPAEDARVWQSLQEARKGAARKRSRWMWPGLATGAAAAAVAVMVFWGPWQSGPSTEESLAQVSELGTGTRDDGAQSLTHDLTLEGVEPEAAPEEIMKREPGVRGAESGTSTSGQEEIQEILPEDPNSPMRGVVVPEDRYPVGQDRAEATAPEGDKVNILNEGSQQSYSIDSADRDRFPVESFEESPSRPKSTSQGDDRHVRGGRKGEVQYEAAELSLAGPSGGGAGKPGIRKLADEGTKSITPPPPISVGGTDPVNDEPYDAMFFKSYGVNPFVAVEDDRYATFAMDVDNASYTMARRYLLGGNLPPAEAVRVEEFINTLKHHYPAPSGKLMASRTAVPSKFGTFAIYLDAGPSPYNAANALLRVGLKGREVERAFRKDANLTFVIDVSGSMGRENRLSLVKQSLHILLDELRPTDRLALVVYGTNARVVLPPTDAEEVADIRSAIDALVTEGSTNAEAGLREGYALAAGMYTAGDINRVILCSDGVANVGRTGADSILEVIRQEAGRGIELTAVGFGLGNYNDVLMEQLANKGDGNYYYVDTLREAERIFREGLTGTLETIAKDSKIQVEFTEGVVQRYRLLGYENRDVADEDFRNDAVDAGEVGAGHEVTALFELRLEDDVDPKDTAAIVRIRYENPSTGEVIEEARELRVSMIEDRLEAMDAGFRLDAAAAQFAEVLRGSYWAKEVNLAQVAELARRASRDLGRPEQAEELTGLIERALALREK